MHWEHHDLMGYEWSRDQEFWLLIGRECGNTTTSCPILSLREQGDNNWTFLHHKIVELVVHLTHIWPGNWFSDILCETSETFCLQNLSNTELEESEEWVSRLYTCSQIQDEKMIFSFEDELWATSLQPFSYQSGRESGWDKYKSSLCVVVLWVVAHKDALD